MEIGVGMGVGVSDDDVEEIQSQRRGEIQIGQVIERGKILG
jgi:hypothetical protein